MANENLFVFFAFSFILFKVVANRINLETFALNRDLVKHLWSLFEWFANSVAQSPVRKTYDHRDQHFPPTSSAVTSFRHQWLKSATQNKWIMVW